MKCHNFEPKIYIFIKLSWQFSCHVVGSNPKQDKNLFDCLIVIPSQCLYDHVYENTDLLLPSAVQRNWGIRRCEDKNN